MVKTALIDSSIQGFAQVHALLQMNPNLEFVYLHDAAIHSLHEKTALLRRVKKDVRFLISRGAKQIILLDDKLCSLILNDLRNSFSNIEFLDCLSLAVKKIISFDKKRILICADEQTIAENRYQKELTALDPKLIVIQKSCSPLEHMLEKVNDPFFIQNYLESALVQLKEEADLVVLANSAYIAYKRIFESILKCPAYTKTDLLEIFLFEKSNSFPQQVCFTTSDPNQMKLMIKNLFDQDVIAEMANID